MFGIILIFPSKDALQDEVTHVQLEMQELQIQLEKISSQNAILNRDKNQLLIRFESLTKDIEKLERQVNNLRSDKSQLTNQIDDLNHDLNEADSETKKWKNNNDELKIQKENLSKQMKALKDSLEEEIARAELEKVHLEEERLELQERYNNEAKF